MKKKPELSKSDALFIMCLAQEQNKKVKDVRFKLIKFNKASTDLAKLEIIKEIHNKWIKLIDEKNEFTMCTKFTQYMIDLEEESEKK